MIHIINAQTDWYKTKSKQFEKLRIEILKQTPQGQYILAIRTQDAMNKMNFIIDMANSIAEHFNPGFMESEHSKLLARTRNSINKLIALDLEFKRNKVYIGGGYSGNHTDIRNGIPSDEFIVTNEKQKQFFKDFHLKNSESIIQPKQTKK